jgi:hypothetical protein
VCLSDADTDTDSTRTAIHLVLVYGCTYEYTNSVVFISRNKCRVHCASRLQYDWGMQLWCQETRSARLSTVLSLS